MNGYAKVSCIYVTSWMIETNGKIVITQLLLEFDRESQTTSSTKRIIHVNGHLE